MKAKELDKKFDEGEDITMHLDLRRARRKNQEARRVNVDFPSWMIHSLDKEAKPPGRNAAIHYQGLDFRTTERKDRIRNSGRTSAAKVRFASLPRTVERNRFAEL